ncbi:hypothetical protein [Chlorobaculum parvum]|uniref:hypothetical protein n=1 Tax=Chlorobaculum parvum TaxID=274539 RepID=UPI0018DD74E1|nr:hypothetical protein [Chlorobaculum parvum]
MAAIATVAEKLESFFFSVHGIYGNGILMDDRKMLTRRSSLFRFLQGFARLLENFQIDAEG